MLTTIVKATDKTYLLFMKVEGVICKSLGLFEKKDIMDRFRLNEEQFKQLCK